MKALRCAVLIPSYNNANTIGKVIDDVLQYTEDVFVVIDGSTDNTREVLSRYNNIEIIDYQKNKGKGYALKTGLRAVRKAGFRYAITIDSDGQHYADDIPTFLDKIEQNPDSMLVGARNLVANNMPQKNTFANKFSNFWYKIETGETLSDTQSGYRLYPLDKLQNIKLLTQRYEFEVEIIVRAAWRGIKVENVPIKVYYAPENERISHFRPFQDFARISLLNTVLVICALLYYYPKMCLKKITLSNVKKFIDSQVVHSKDSNIKMALAMGWGVFCGIIPIWGYQMVFAGVSAHFMRLNKVIAVVFSNISIPPMIPFLLYGSMVMGAFILGRENTFLLNEISLESIGTALWQYIIGSICLALLLGLATFIIAWTLMKTFKREKHNE